MLHTEYMPLAVGILGFAYGRRGDKVEAQKVLKEAETRFQELRLPSAMLADVHGGMGNRERFFECLYRAYEGRSPLLPWLKAYPEHDAMRSDPRFDELVRRMGLA